MYKCLSNNQKLCVTSKKVSTLPMYHEHALIVQGFNYKPATDSLIGAFRLEIVLESATDLMATLQSRRWVWGHAINCDPAQSDIITLWFHQLQAVALPFVQPTIGDPFHILSISLGPKKGENNPKFSQGFWAGSDTNGGRDKSQSTCINHCQHVLTNINRYYPTVLQSSTISIH